MSTQRAEDRHLTEDGVRDDLQRQPHLFMKLAENTLTVAESLRDNYFKNTTKFISVLRHAMHRGRPEILRSYSVGNIQWADVQGEVITFIDGGVGQAEISSQVPILLRVGSYCVRTGSRHLAEREQFGYYPVIFGDLEGGSKTRKDFVDIVRITAELLGGLSALQRIPDLKMLMFHGPLVYLMSGYAGHTPFTEGDIDLFLHQYMPSPEAASALKEEFLREANIDIYPRITNRSDEWINRRLFEPLSWIAFLYRRLIREASRRDPIPLIVGVVERGRLRQFSERILLERMFRELRANGKADWFNKIYGRTDLTSPESLLDKLGYTDTLLLAMLLKPGQYSEPWDVAKYEGLTRGTLSLPGEAHSESVDFSFLKSRKFGFPQVTGCYVHVSERTEPIRVETFKALGDDQVSESARRVLLYARLLPGYGFPVGLDVVDKYAHVPAWLTRAYGKLIRHHLGVSLQQGEISDAEMRRLIIQAIYMTHRDWLYRPEI